MQLAFEIQTDDRAEIGKLQEQFPEQVQAADVHGIEGTEWLAFVVEMSKTLAPHVFALLTIYMTRNRKVVVIHNGERKELTERELEKLKQEIQSSQPDNE